MIYVNSETILNYDLFFSPYIVGSYPQLRRKAFNNYLLFFIVRHDYTKRYKNKRNGILYSEDVFIQQSCTEYTGKKRVGELNDKQPRQRHILLCVEEKRVCSC